MTITHIENRILEVIAINWLKMIVSLLIGLAAGTAAVILYYRKGISKAQKELGEKTARQQHEAEQLLGEAQKAGEQRKRELLLQAKEEIHKARLDLEREVRDRKAELTRDRSRMDQKEEALDRKVEAQERSEKELLQRLAEAKARQEQIEQLRQQKQLELERVAGLSMEEAHALVLETARNTYRHDLAVMLKQMEDEARETAELKAKEIVVTAIQRYSADYVSESTVSVVTLPNDEMKGRIIGREGRNIRAIETITGVDVIIDDTPEAVILSSFDPIRREIARMALEKLIQDGRIHPARIEEMTQKASRELDQRIKAEGEKACFDTGVMGLHPELVKMLGRLHFRTSYGQNALQHSEEVSWIAGMMAAELGLDVDMAKRAGLLHDIGKALDFEQEGTHIQLGANLARKYKENPIVINAIASHHGDVQANSLISCLVAAADAVSAARPGARRENLETYVKRIERLEEIANQTEGVEKSYAIQAGRELRVMVVPDKVSDDDMVLMAHDICKQIEEELNYPGQIKVNIIRETRVTDFAK